jgi:hypothetical protein
VTSILSTFVPGASPINDVAVQVAQMICGAVTAKSVRARWFSPDGSRRSGAGQVRPLMTPTMRHYLEGRLFEWVMATAMILLAVQTFVWPRTLGASAFHLLIVTMPSRLSGSSFCCSDWPGSQL